MKISIKDIVLSGSLLLFIFLTSLFVCHFIYSERLFPSDFQGIIAVLIFFLLVILFSIAVGRAINFLWPIEQGTFDLQSGAWSIQIWKTLGFLNLFNLSLLIHTYLCPVNLRGFVYWLLGTPVGKYNLIGGKIIEPLMVSLGDEVILGEDSLVLGHLITKNKLFLGKVVIGNQVTIGAKSIIMPDVIIEDGAVVWAGSLVPRGARIKKNEEWSGVPARKRS